MISTIISDSVLHLQLDFLIFIIKLNKCNNHNPRSYKHSDLQYKVIIKEVLYLKWNSDKIFMI